MKPNNPSRWQSVDSAQPNFVMPSDWHNRRVDAVFFSNIASKVQLIGWDASSDSDTYCVKDENGKVFGQRKLSSSTTKPKPKPKPKPNTNTKPTVRFA